MSGLLRLRVLVYQVVEDGMGWEIQVKRYRACKLCTHGFNILYVMFHLHPTDLLFKFLLFSNHSVPSLCHVMKRSPLKGRGEARFCSMQIVQSAVHQAVVSLFYSSTKFGWATNFTSCWYAGDLVESEPWKSMKIHETCLIHRILSQPINSMSFIKPGLFPKWGLVAIFPWQATAGNISLHGVHSSTCHGLQWLSIGTPTRQWHLQSKLACGMLAAPPVKDEV